MLADLLFLCYPRYCPACGFGLPPAGQLLCLSCSLALPLTGQHRLPENRFTERFWGRLPLVAGAAMFSFVKGGRVQRLVHALKYEGRVDVGRRLGRRYGRCLADAPPFAGIEAVTAVPLHPRKQRRRGYNQSAVLGRAIARELGLPFCADALRRTQYTETQTRMSRQERVENVQRAFALARPRAVAGQHVLLVDDVLTTGATLEACGRLLLERPGTRLSLATLAIAWE